MSEDNGQREEPQAPAPPDGASRPRIGVDEWVARQEGRREHGVLARAQVALGRVPDPARMAIFLGLAAIPPFVLGGGDLFRFGVFTLLYVLLAQGLNVVVGFAGLLDLGYIAFFGFGAYTYALLSSSHEGIHWPAIAAIPAVLVACALLGLLLGLPSWRLLGDYLAIVTLFFGQAFVSFVNNANPKGLTGGANGIADIDNLEFFGFELTTTRDYYFFALGSVAVVMAAVWSLSRSRIGRAWQALREDPLAAELMGMPVNRLKLAAFSLGAAIAGLSGAIFAALATGVAPGAFDVSLLIIVYAIVILGGMGSLTGVLLGAIIVNVSFEILTPATPGTARLLFYIAVIVGLALALRAWTRLAVLLAATAALGYGVHALVASQWPSWTAGAVESGGFLGGAIKSWVLIPADNGRWPQYAYLALIAAVVIVVRLRGWVRLLALAPVLYLTAFVWENLLVQQPSVTRLVLFGALLIALMQVRPQGLMGTARVEIV
ncbi:MAG: branched-chain amino acid ABC transporter permease [Actinomycetota bacterium]|nr:branched-chain amino acid ABC transporter permease [Actinomycetota bacterium]